MDPTFMTQTCTKAPNVFTNMKFNNYFSVEPYTGILIEAEINRAYAQALLPSNSEFSEISFKPFILHQTIIRMGDSAATNLNNLIGKTT